MGEAAPSTGSRSLQGEAEVEVEVTARQLEEEDDWFVGEGACVRELLSGAFASAAELPVLR